MDDRATGISDDRRHEPVTQADGTAAGTLDTGEVRWKKLQATMLDSTATRLLARELASVQQQGFHAPLRKLCGCDRSCGSASYDYHVLHHRPPPRTNSRVTRPRLATSLSRRSR